MSRDNDILTIYIKHKRVTQKGCYLLWVMIADAERQEKDRGILGVRTVFLKKPPTFFLTDIQVTHTAIAFEKIASVTYACTY